MDSITIKDIAKICGVSVSTVSRAINNTPGINDETKDIAILIKGLNNPFFSPMITEFEKEIKKKKYTFILQRVDENQDEIEVAIELEKEKRLKGIVFLGGYFSHSREKLEKLTVPFVLSTVGRPKKIEGVKYSSVAVDDKKESYKIVDYLCKMGHKKIAIISATDDDDKSIGKLRFEGYKRALFDNNIEFDPNLVYYLQSGNDRYSMQSGYVAGKKIIKEKADCTAIFAITDIIAIGTLRAISEEGYKVPEDYSVAGYDGLELSRYYIPSLTTIRQPVEKIAVETLKVLFDMINKNSDSVDRVFEGELIIGESVKRI